MNGLLNLAYPLLGGIDSYFLWLPDVVRVALWGAVSGLLAMMLYVLMSNQGSIKAMQGEARQLRGSVQQADDAGEAARLALENLKLSFRVLGKVTLPAMLSGIPVIFVLAWLAATYDTVAPPAGAPVPVTAEPADVALQLTPPAAEPSAIAWPAPGGEYQVADSTGTIFAAPATATPPTIVHKRVWWNVLLGNEAGYLPDSAAVDAIHLAVPSRELWSVGPSWMHGWLFVYLVSLIIVSLFVKFAFKIA
ncbi:MAG: hypothetical protein U1E14_01100 [Geminicoccaceae bacterium]